MVTIMICKTYNLLVFLLLDFTTRDPLSKPVVIKIAYSVHHPPFSNGNSPPQRTGSWNQKTITMIKEVRLKSLVLYIENHISPHWEETLSGLANMS